MYRWTAIIIIPSNSSEYTYSFVKRKAHLNCLLSKGRHQNFTEILYLYSVYLSLKPDFRLISLAKYHICYWVTCDYIFLMHDSSEIILMSKWTIITCSSQIKWTGRHGLSTVTIKGIHIHRLNKPDPPSLYIHLEMVSENCLGYLEIYERQWFQPSMCRINTFYNICGPPPPISVIFWCRP